MFVLPPPIEIHAMRKVLCTTLLPFLLPPLLTQPLTGQNRPGLQGRTSALPVTESDAADRDLRMTPEVRAVQRSADSIVSIYVNHAVEQAFIGGRQEVTEGQGSGVIIDDSGFLITNWHVIAAVLNRSDYSLEVKLKDGRALPARVVSSSTAHDLALLLLQLPAGQHVKPVAIGAPTT